MYAIQTPSLTPLNNLSHSFSGWNSTITPPPSLYTAHSASPTNFPVSPVIYITVGAGGNLTFDPSSVHAQIDKILRFDFVGGNHSLTQSSLIDPCQNVSLFDTGFTQFNPMNTSGKFLVDYKVSSTDPQWFYCAQRQPKSHCQSGGMIFRLNPPISDSVSKVTSSTTRSLGQCIAHPSHSTSPSTTSFHHPETLSPQTEISMQVPNTASVLQLIAVWCSTVFFGFAI
ncbi:unnamed protein product [Periconia digitata]|uniref:Phytocyanin domain-containing protein n=1 Tax=Periconia digitata TaxID=1303443 RepID=A0A9W4ULX3_9PLEO|nr:unnamed protein product [Periconia digitata]